MKMTERNRYKTFPTLRFRARTGSHFGIILGCGEESTNEGFCAELIKIGNRVTETNRVAFRLGVWIDFAFASPKPFNFSSSSLVPSSEEERSAPFDGWEFAAREISGCECG